MHAYAMVASRNGKIIYDATGTTVSLISAATHQTGKGILIGTNANFILIAR